LIYAKYICGLLEGCCRSQHSSDMFLFDFLQREPITKSCAGITWQKVFWKTLDTNMISLTENGCPFNNVSQLPEVSWPVVSFEGLKRLWGKTEKEMMPGLTKKG